MISEPRMPGEIEEECLKRRQYNKRRNLRNRFEIVKTLGQGTYGKVKLAIERETGEPFAIKTIKKKQIATEEDLQRLHREIEIMTHLNHPHIISVYEVFENSDKIILVMEYASGGELYDYCNNKQGLYDDEARKFFRQIVSAVHYLHMNGIVHRDLKLENIVLDYNGDCKIADFGFANICRQDSLLSTFCGSPLYASPEIVNGLPYHGPEVDCWSLGVLLYAMVYGAMPFDGSDFRCLRNQITAGEYFAPNRPSDAEDLIAKLLCPNAHRRATITDITSNWWVNLGYHHSPVDDTLPGKPVDQKSLLIKLFDSSSVSQIQSSAKSNSSQPNFDNTSLSNKGILKMTKKEAPASLGNQVELLHRSQSLDANINLAASSDMDSQKVEASNTNVIFDSNKMPKKSILKKQCSQCRGNCGAKNAEGVLSLDRDLSASPDLVSLPQTAITTGKSLSEPDSDNTDSALEEPTFACYDLCDIEAVLDGLIDDEVFHDNVAAQSPLESVDITEDSGIVDGSSSETSPVVPENLDLLAVQGDTSTEAVQSGVEVGKKRKGILKNKRDSPTWGHSISSQGSSSSTDLLNFSFDSTDGEGFLTEYFSMSLTLPMVNDKSVALEMAPLPNQLDEEEDDTISTPPPLPSCPPPFSSAMPYHANFNLPQNDDEIVEKMFHLGNEDASSQPPDEKSSQVIDWCEVQDIYQKALELHSEWS